MKPKGPSESTMLKWSKKGYPHKGWKHQGVTDLGNDVGVCFMCEKKRLKYVHKISHLVENKQVEVGVVCAGHLIQDYELANNRNRDTKNKAKRLKNFKNRQWETTGQFENRKDTLITPKVTFEITRDNKGYLISTITLKDHITSFQGSHDYTDLHLILSELFEVYENPQLLQSGP